MDQQDHTQQGYNISPLVKLGDLEERQRLLRDRILLVGKNLIDSRETSDKEISQLKRDTEEMKRDIIKIKEILTSLSEEFTNFARRSDLIILEKQWKMFSPLEIARISDVKKLINEKLKNK